MLITGRLALLRYALLMTHKMIVQILAQEPVVSESIDIVLDAWLKYTKEQEEKGNSELRNGLEAYAI